MRLTTFRRPRRLLHALVLPLVVASATVFGLAEPAAASASGCTYGGKPVDRCVYVNGSGTHVNYIEGTIRYQTGLYLQIEVWGDGVYYLGHGDPTTPSDTTFVHLNVNRNLANNSWVCVAARWTDGSQVSPACIQIHS